MKSTTQSQLNHSTRSPVIVCPCSVAALCRAWSGAGAELGPGPRVRDADRGAGGKAFSGGGREALSVAGGFRVLLELQGLQLGLCSVCAVLPLEQEEEEEPP